MASDNSYMLFYTTDEKKTTFSLDRFPLDLIPTLISQLKQFHYMESERICRPHFKEVRAENARRQGLSPEGQMSLALKLKNS